MNDVKEITEKGKSAGVLAERIESTLAVIGSMKDCRRIEIRWIRSDDSNSNMQQLGIGKPGIEWPNADIYDAMYTAIVEVLERRAKEDKAKLSVLLGD